MYMRLLGYPGKKITLLSTYNGQKHLLRDVVRQRCAWNPLFGEPDKITTVDKFQGQQNDFVIISLVRTEHVGHIRDVRRLVVAMSRARYGLYVFGRFALYENCFELAPTNLFRKRPLRLALVPTESETTERLCSTEVKSPLLVKDVEHMWDVLQKRMQKKFVDLQAEADALAQEEEEEEEAQAEAEAVPGLE